VNDIGDWLLGIGLGRLIGLFEQSGIELQDLHELSNEDLKDIGIDRLADRKQLMKEIAGLAAKRAQTSAERRVLSVMFCDLVGSTALSTELDPEELREALLLYQRATVERIQQHGGFVASYMGDGVLAYFGWPYASEDQAALAVRAGLDAVLAVRHLQIDEQRVLHCRVGIATGRVVVGGQSHLDSAVGETPNLAARLQAAAGADEVVVDKATHHAIGQRFESRALDLVAFKGFAHPVEAWCVVRERTEIDRFESRPSSGAKFVGRQRDLDVLLWCWRQAQSGAAQTVIVEGEAGIGKSRLVREFEIRLRGYNPAIIRFQCSPYHTSSAFYPAIHHLEMAAGIDQRDEPPGGKLAKLAKLFEASIAEDPRALFVLSELLSLPVDQPENAPPLSPLQRRSLIIKLLVGNALKLASRGALLVIIEDAHWIDPSSQELLTALVNGTTRAPVVTVVTHRPIPATPWAQELGATMIELGPLEDAEIRAIACGVDSSRQLPDTDIERIVSRVEGIPLFAEEITSAALERATGGEFGLPETIQASLAARLDALGNAKEMAQIASVLGRDFRVSQLSALAGIPPALVERTMSTLMASGLVLKVGRAVVPTYRFKHALVQDVAYQSILKYRRRELHQRVFREILTDATKNREPEIAAHHLTEAGVLAEAIQYWKQAGQRAARASANVEAISHFSRGLELIDKLPADCGRDTLEFSLRVGLAAPLIASKGYTSDDLKSCIAHALALSRKIGNTPELFSILYTRWAYLLTAGFMVESRKIAEEFSDLAERQNDTDALYARYRMLGASHMCLGNLRQAVTYLDLAIDRYEPELHARLVTSYGVDIRVAARCFRAEVAWLMGHPHDAKASAAAALEEARRTKHVHSIAMALFFCGLISFLCRDEAAVCTHVEDLFRLAARQPIGAWPTLGRAMAGWAEAESGKREEGLAAMNEGVRAAQKAGVSMFLPFFLGRVAEMLLSSGNLTEAEGYVDEAESLITRTEEVSYKADIRCSRACLLGLRSRPDEADMIFAEAMELASSQDAKMIELRIATRYAGHLEAQGQYQRARVLLRAMLESINEGQTSADIDAARSTISRLTRKTF